MFTYGLLWTTICGVTVSKRQESNKASWEFLIKNGVSINVGKFPAPWGGILGG
jgi:hypothetical protein